MKENNGLAQYKRGTTEKDAYHGKLVGHTGIYHHWKFEKHFLPYGKSPVLIWHFFDRSGKFETPAKPPEPAAFDSRRYAVQTQTEVNVETLLLTADINVVRRFGADLNTHAYSNRRLPASLRRFAAFTNFGQPQLCWGNPAMTIKTPKQDKKLPKFLEYEQVLRLPNTPAKHMPASRPGI